MASQITNYKCPACTGPLHFVGASGKLECDFCGGDVYKRQVFTAPQAHFHSPAGTGLGWPHSAQNLPVLPL